MTNTTIEKTEEMNENKNLPQGWIECELEDFTNITMGQSPPSASYNEDKIGLPFYQGKAEFGEVYPTVKKWCSASNKIAQKGDILLSVRAPVGATNICPEESCIGRGLAAIRGLAGINNIFIINLLKTYENQMHKVSTGTTFSAITGEKLRKLKLPLPPLAEQERIVDKIEELFSDIDSGIKNLEDAKLQIKQYRQSVLKFAFEGKLYQIAEWKPKKMLEFCIFKSGNTINKHLEKKFGEIPYVKVGDMNLEGNKICIITSRRFVNIGDINQNQIIPVNSVIFPKRGGAIATNKKRKVIKPIIIDLNTMAIIPPKELNSELLYYWILGIDLSKLSNGGAVPQINNYSFENIFFNLPSKEEQQKIVEEIEKRFEVADVLEQAVDEGLERAKQLKQSILKKAFEGKLVPQYSSDEPASILLEKIKAEKIKKEVKWIKNK